MNFKEASELAKKSPGSVLRRNESGEFIVITREGNIQSAEVLPNAAPIDMAVNASAPDAKVYEITVSIFRGSGAVFVFDSEISHPNPDFVFAFSLSAGKFREYEQSVFFNNLRKADEGQATRALNAYKQWKAENFKSFIEVVSRDTANILTRSQKVMAQRIKEKMNADYRSTRCHSCGAALSTETSKICSKCGGLKCECSSCLCQFGVRKGG